MNYICDIIKSLNGTKYKNNIRKVTIENMNDYYLVRILLNIESNAVLIIIDYYSYERQVLSISNTTTSESTLVIKYYNPYHITTEIEDLIDNIDIN